MVSMLCFTSPWLFCNYQSVLLNPFHFFTHWNVLRCSLINTFMSLHTFLHWQLLQTSISGPVPLSTSSASTLRLMKIIGEYIETVQVEYHGFQSSSNKITSQLLSQSPQCLVIFTQPFLSHQFYLCLCLSWQMTLSYIFQGNVLNFSSSHKIYSKPQQSLSVGGVFFLFRVKSIGHIDHLVFNFLRSIPKLFH